MIYKVHIKEVYEGDVAIEASDELEAKDLATRDFFDGLVDVTTDFNADIVDVDYTCD